MSPRKILLFVSLIALPAMGQVYQTSGKTKITGGDNLYQADVNLLPDTTKAIVVDVRRTVAVAGTGTSQSDNTSFSAGTTALVPVGGAFNDSMTAITTGNAGVARITANRGLHVNLRDASGVEISPATNAGQTTINTSIGTTNTTLSTINGKLNSNFGTDSGGLRVNAQLGNSGGSASFGAGTTGSQTIRTSANLSDGSANSLTSSTVGATRSLDANVTQQVLQLDRTATGTITALNGAVAVSCAGAGSAAVNITGTWSATLIFEGTTDASTWVGITALSSGSGSTAATTISANNLFVVNCGGYAQVRVRASAFTSGTASLAWNAGAGGNVVSAYQPYPAALQVTSWPAVVATTLPSAGTSGTIDQLTVDQYGLAAVRSERSTLTLWGKMFFTSTNYLSTGATAETNLALFRNPNGSGVNCYIRFLNWSAGASGNLNWKVYRGPTVTLNGTATTTVGGRTSGQATAQCILSTAPVTSVRGTGFLNRYSQNNSSSIQDNMDGTIIIEPNTSILITATQSLLGQAGNFDISWSEVAQ